MSLISKLSWPPNSKIHLLIQCLDEESLISLIEFFADLGEEDRKIRLPRHSVIKKLLAHYLVRQVNEGLMSWEQVNRYLKGSMFKTLKELDISRKELRRLHAQRELEIAREIERENK